MSNYLELYEKNLNFEKSKDYELLRKYEKYIKDPKHIKCPFDKKDDVIMINNEDNITIKCRKSDLWYITITKSKSINLYQKLNDISNIRKNILNEITQGLNKDSLNLTKFNNLKENYKEINESYSQINEILNIQNKELKDLKNEIIDLKFKIGNLFYEKNNAYDIIKPFFTLKINKLFKKIYFTDKTMNDGLIKNFSKNNEIPIDNTRKILDWYNLNKKYIELSNELIIKEMNYDELTKKFNNINLNFLVKIPEINENKKEINKKKKYKTIKIKK